MWSKKNTNFNEKTFQDFWKYHEAEEASISKHHEAEASSEK